MEVGSVQVSARLSLEQLISDAKKAQNLLQQTLKDVEVDVSVNQGGLSGITNAANRFVEATSAASQYTQAIDIVAQRLQLASAQINDFNQQITTAYINFDSARAKVATLSSDADTLAASMQQLAKELDYQANSTDLLNASYDVLSSGFSDAADISGILEASVKGAQGGFSDVGTVADATTTILNAYKLSAEDAAKVVDILAQTQDKGKITIDQYAGSVGRAASIAALSGVSFEELSAAVATATAKGVPAESSISGVRQAIVNLIKPTQDAQEYLEKFGITNAAATLKSEGLIGILDRLKKGGASNTELAKIFSDVDALATVTPLAGTNLDDFRANLEAMGNSAGKAEKSAAQVANSFQGQFTAAMNQANESLVSLGKGATNAFIPLLGALTSLLINFNQLPEPIKEGAGTIIALTGGVVGLGAALASIAAVLPVMNAGFKVLSGEALLVAKSMFAESIAAYQAAAAGTAQATASAASATANTAEAAAATAAAAANQAEAVASGQAAAADTAEAAASSAAAAANVAQAGATTAAAGAATAGAAASGGFAISLAGVAAASKVLIASLAPLLVQLVAIGAAIKLIEFYKLTADLTNANTAIEGFSAGVNASTGAAISAAERTKSVVDKLNAAKKEGRALTQQEIADAQNLVKANKLRIDQLEEQLKQAEALPAADEAQKNSRQALIAQINTSINALKGQTSALDALTGATQSNTDATVQGAEDQKSAIDSITGAYDSELNALENSLKQRQAAIAQSATSEEDLRQQNLKAEQDYLNQRVNLNQRKLAELKAAQQATSDPKQLEAIGAEITKTEQAIQNDRLSIAQQGAQARFDAEKTSTEKAEQDRKAAQEKALADFERANDNATRAVENSQNQRTAAIRQAQLAGLLTEEQAQSQIQQIQQDGIKETIAAKEDELSRVNDLRQQGVLTEQEASDKEAELTKELGQLKLNQIEAELEAQRAARAEAIAGIEAEANARRSKLEGKSGQLDLRAGSLQSELDLLNARNDLASALGGLEQERLNTQIAIAEQAGNSEQVERLKQQQLQLQSQQLDRQYQAQKEQLKVQQELKKIELEREKLNAQIAVIEAEAALAKATAEGADSRELNALKEVLNLRKQQVGAIDDVIARQDELNSMQNQVVDVQYQTERERQRQSRIQQEQQSTTDTGTGTEARSTRPSYDPRTQFLGRDGRVYNRQMNASTSTASRLLQTPAIAADSPLRQPGITGQIQGAATATAVSLEQSQIKQILVAIDGVSNILKGTALRPNLSVTSPQPIADAARVYADIASKAANI